MSFQPLISVWVATVLGFTAAGASTPRQNTEKEILQRFQQRIDEYVALHQRLENDMPPVKRDDPEQLRAAQRAIAAKIRAEWKNTKQGVFFPSVTRTVFRQRLRTQLSGPDGTAVRKALEDDAPSPIPLRAFSEYPAGWPLSTVPPSVLAALPKLPDHLEYRFVGRDMILLDAHANLILDFIHDAFR